jgi:hypothetical protein
MTRNVTINYRAVQTENAKSMSYHPLLLKVKRHMACKVINDIQIRKRLDKNLHQFFFLFNPSRFVFKSIPQPQVTVYLTF